MIVLNPNKLDEELIKFTNIELISFLMKGSYLKKERICNSCSIFMRFVKHKRNLDEYAWRCLFLGCSQYSQFASIRKGSFFKGFSGGIRFIMRVLLKYFTRQQLHTIINYFSNVASICKICHGLINFFTFHMPKCISFPNKYYD